VLRFNTSHQIKKNKDLVQVKNATETDGSNSRAEDWGDQKIGETEPPKACSLKWTWLSYSAN